MMRLYLLIFAALALLLPGVSFAEPCATNDTGGNVWPSVTGGTWSDCTASNDDTFTLDGDRVVVTGDIAITSGNTVLSGGMLSIGPGINFQPGVNLNISGGTLHSEGSVITECRIIDSIDYTTHASQITVNVDCDTSGIDDATDWVVFPWENTASETYNRMNLLVGPGTAPPGSTRPASKNAGAWYPIDSHTVTASGVSSYSITYDVNEESGNYTGTPYAGTRNIPTQSDPINMGDTAEVLACVPGALGLRSAVHFAHGFDMVGIDADLGNRYLAFDEIEADNDHSDCGGMQAKVLHSREDPGDSAIIAGLLDDGGSVTDDTADTIDTATDGDVLLKPATPEVGDAFYVGHERPFDVVTIVVNSASTGGTIVWEYWDGEAWTALSDTDGTNSFTTTGSNTVDWSGSRPADWQRTVVGRTAALKYGSLYYARARVTVAGTTATADSVLVADGDTIWVAGDVCGCTTGQAHLTMGAQRGDTIKVVRPAIIDGDTDGDLVGEGGIQCTSGEIHANWTIFKSLGTVELDAFTPNLDRDANLALVLGGSAGATTQCTGHITNSAFLYPGTEGTWADSAVIGIFSSAGGNRFFEDDPLWSGTNFKFENLYIADGAEDDAAGSGGTHGICINGGANVKFKNTRIEHIDDDGVCVIDYKTDGTATDRESYTFENVLNYENIAGTDNSQSNFQFEMENIADGSSHFYLTNPSWVTLIDVVSIGGYANSISGVGNGITGHRVVSGGILSTSSNPFTMNIDSGGAADTVYTAQGDNFGKTNAPKFYDSIITSYAGDGATAGNANWGRYYNTFFFGNEAARNTTSVGGSLQYPIELKESVFDQGVSASNSHPVIPGVAAQALMSSTQIDVTDFLYRQEFWYRGFGALEDDDANPIYNFTRIAAMNSGDPSNQGPFELPIEDTNATVTINGAWVSHDATESFIFDSEGSGTTLTVDNVCLESNNVEPATTMWSGLTLTDSMVSVTNLSPDINDNTTIRSFIDDGTASVCGGKSKPDYLGLKNFGFAHYMLGDFVVEQADRWSSKDGLVGSVRGGSSVSGKEF